MTTEAVAAQAVVRPCPARPVPPSGGATAWTVPAGRLASLRAQRARDRAPADAARAARVARWDRLGLVTREDVTADQPGRGESPFLPVPWAERQGAELRLVDALVELDEAEGAVRAATARRTVLLARAYGLALECAQAWDPTASPDTWRDAPPDRVTALHHAQTVAEIGVLLAMSEQTIATEIAQAREVVEHRPLVLGALERGEVSSRHVQVLLQGTAGLDGEASAAADEQLLPGAGDAPPSRLKARTRRWRERHHPVPVEVRHREAAADRHVELLPVEDGMAWLSALMPAVQAQAIHAHLDACATEVVGPDEERTLGQLRVDVLIDLLLHPTRAHLPSSEKPLPVPPSMRTACPAGRTGDADDDPSRDASVAGDDRVRGLAEPGADLVDRVRGTVFVTVPLLSLLGHGDQPAELSGYGPVTIDQARDLLLAAGTFSVLCTDPATDQVVGMGRTTYRVTAAIRRLLRLRDGTCRFPGCTRTAAVSDLDHTRAWVVGGGTDPDNLAHLCRRHHRLKHGSDWSVTQHADGTLTWVSPLGQTRTTHPEVPISGRPPDPPLPPDPPPPPRYPDEPPF